MPVAPALPPAQPSTGSENVNDEPSPTVDCTWISPPSRWAMRAQIARPRPVPPWVRVVDASPWANAVKIRESRSAGRPIPVSTTSRTSVPGAVSASGRRRGAAARWLARIRTPPRSVNFSPLPTRLMSTWRRRTRSLQTSSGTSGSTDHHSDSPRRSAFVVNIVQTSWTSARTSVEVDSISSSPLSSALKYSVRVRSTTSPCRRTSRASGSRVSGPKRRRSVSATWTRGRRRIARMRRHTSRPSIWGSEMSRRTTSGSCRRAASTPAAPSSACTTRKPSDSRSDAATDAPPRIRSGRPMP